MKKKLIVASAVILPLSGCGLPPAISIASMLLDVGSYAATGKSTTDHVISAMAGEDCALMQVFEGNLCEEEQNFEDALATLQPLGDGQGEVQVAQTEPINYKTVYIDPVESGEPVGMQVGHMTPFVKVPVTPEGEPIEADSFVAGGEEAAPGSVQLARNDALLSTDPVIQDDAYLSDVDLPNGGAAEPVGEPVSIFAPESVKQAAAAQQPATEQQSVEPSVKEEAEPFVLQAALVSPEESPQAPEGTGGVEIATAEAFAADPFVESNSLLDVAQHRAIHGTATYEPQARENERSWDTVGSLGSSLRAGR